MENHGYPENDLTQPADDLQVIEHLQNLRILSPALEKAAPEIILSML